ncbi:MAG: glycosyltransferase family 39 protein [Anaerolineaceae bacterium]|nr:glycosyltransferase family 39 protein [Anaerolineaceae bacterium]
MVLIVNRIADRFRGKFNQKLSPTLQVVLEIMLVLAIWLIASFIWIKTPYSNSYFLLGPQPPDGYYLPKSDARLMDLGGQYLIIGGKLETPYFTEKPFYSLFLGLIHFFFGQSYQTVTNIQILFLAFIPVLLYLLGKQLSGKLFGISLAAYAIIKEATSLLFTFKISSSNSRLMMTEVPSALLLILTAYLIFTWLKKEKPGKALPLLAGTVMGVAGFVRSNNLVVIALIFIYLIFIWRKQIKSRLPQLLFFILGIAIAILPWTVYNQINYETNPLTWKIQAALSTRFAPKLDDVRQEFLEDTATLEPTKISDSTTEELATAQATSIPESGVNEPSTAGDNDVATIGNAENGTIDFYKSKISMVLGHFLNNQIKSLFVLPFQIYPAHPTTILEQEYWKEPVTWDGEMPLEHILAFCLNLIFISLGIATAWKNFRWAGLIPLVIQMSYYLSNALVRTSGSRYLVPVDWVVYLYFLLGIFTLLRKLNLLPEFIPGYQKEAKPSKLPFYLSLAFSLIIGFSLPVLNVAFPTLYHNESKEMVLARLPMEKIEQEIEINSEDMKEFYDNPNTVFLYGREIYPAYQQTEDLVGGKALTFTLLTPDLYEISIPYGIELTKNLPNGEDMIALGCQDPETKNVLTYLVYFVQSDELLWSTSTTFKDICSQTN